MIIIAQFIYEDTNTHSVQLFSQYCEFFKRELMDV